MLKSILNLQGVKELDQNDLRNIKGNGWACIRTKNGVSETFFGNQSSGTATAWVNAWGSMGWNTSCAQM